MHFMARTTGSRFIKGLAFVLVALIVTGFANSFIARGNLPVEASRKKPWLKEIKGVLQNFCMESTQQSLLKTGLESQGEDVRLFKINYCDCLLERVEKAQVVAIEYEGMTAAQVLASARLVRNFEHFLQSPTGAGLVSICKGSALTEFSTPDGVSSNN